MSHPTGSDLQKGTPPSGTGEGLRHRGASGEIETDVEAGEGAKKAKVLDLQYTIDDTPPWYLCIILGFQHYLTMFGATLAIPIIVAPSMCIAGDDVATSEILGTILFVSGLVTVLQSTMGVRLPIVQGGTFAFLVPTFAILNLPKWQCPPIVDRDQYLSSSTTVTSAYPNVTEPPIYTGSPEHREVWQQRMREIQGAIILASLFQVVIGMSGVIGLMLNFIGPLAIAPTIALIGISLFEPAADFSSKNWWVAIMTMVLVTMFSQYLRNIEVPCGRYNRKKKKVPTATLR